MKELVIVIIMSLGVTQGLNASEAYPSHWWTPVDSSDVPDWEVLPQEAEVGKEVILSKRNELGQNLSNLGHTPFTFKGQSYQSVEGLWQSMKYPESNDDERANFPGVVWEFTREEVEQKVGWDAMSAGSLGGQNMHKMDIDWVTFDGRKMPYYVHEKGEHYNLILSILRAKVDSNAKVKEVLLSTGNLNLKSDHVMGENPPPAWKYHELYMIIRDELIQAGE